MGVQRARLLADDGFTLVELMVGMVITVIIFGAIAGAMIVSFRTTDVTQQRMSESHDAQISSAYLANDVQSAAVVHLGSGGDCSGAPTTLIRFTYEHGEAVYKCGTSSGEIQVTRTFDGESLVLAHFAGVARPSVSCSAECGLHRNGQLGDDVLHRDERVQLHARGLPPGDQQRRRGWRESSAGRRDALPRFVEPPVGPRWMPEPGHERRVRGRHDRHGAADLRRADGRMDSHPREPEHAVGQTERSARHDLGHRRRREPTGEGGLGTGLASSRPRFPALGRAPRVERRIWPAEGHDEPVPRRDRGAIRDERSDHDQEPEGRLRVDAHRRRGDRRDHEPRRPAARHHDDHARRSREHRHGVRDGPGHRRSCGPPHDPGIPLHQLAERRRGPADRWDKVRLRRDQADDQQRRGLPDLEPRCVFRLQSHNRLLPRLRLEWTATVDVVLDLTPGSAPIAARPACAGVRDLRLSVFAGPVRHVLEDDSDDPQSRCLLP